MLNALLLLLALQVTGDTLVALVGLPIPGMVIGLVLLLAILAARGRWLGAERAVPPGLDAAAKGLHDHLGLLFVPAGAGIVAHFGLLGVEGPALLLAVVVGTATTIGLVGRIALGIGRRSPADGAVARRQS